MSRTVVATLFAAAFVVVALAGHRTRFPDMPVDGYAPQMGIAAAASVLVARRYRASVALAAAALSCGTQLLVGTDARTAIAIGAGCGITTAVFGWLLGPRRALLRLPRGRGVWTMFGATAISATAGAFGTVVGQVATGSTIGREVWVTRLGAEALGILSVAPLVVIATTLRALDVRRWLEVATCGVLVSVTIEVGFHNSGTGQFIFPYLPLAVLLLAVVRVGLAGTTLLPLLFVPLSMQEAISGNGPWSTVATTPFEHLFGAQLFAATGLAGAWIIAGVVAQRASLVDALADANETLEARVDARTVELTSLQELTALAVGVDSLDDVYERFLPRIRTAMGVEAACILVTSEDGEALVCPALGDRGAAPVSIPIGAGVLGRAAESRVPTVICKLTEDPGCGLWHRRPDGLAATPLVAGDRCLGVLCVAAPSGGDFVSGDLLAFLERVAEPLALAIDRARVASQLREANTDLTRRAAHAQLAAGVAQALGEARLDEQATMVLIAREIAESVGDLCVIARASGTDGDLSLVAVHASNTELAESTRAAFLSLPFDSAAIGLTARAMTSGRAVHEGGSVDALLAVSRLELREWIRAHGVHSAVVVPMHCEGQVEGAITVCRNVTADAYSEAEIELLQDLADRAGLALAVSRLHAAIEASEEHFRSAFEHAPVGTAIVSLDEPSRGRFLWVNPTLCELTGYQRDALLSMHYHELAHVDDVEMANSTLIDLTSGSSKDLRHEQRCVHAGGPVMWTRVSASRIEADGPPRAIAHIEDITAQKEAEAQLRHQALHDPLTGLPNRHLFEDRLQLALKQLDRTPGSVAVLYIDLDRFKDVNDTLGHEAGDEVIRWVASRIATTVRAPDSAARLAGDEFVVLCPGASDREAEVIARRLDAVLREPMAVGDQVVSPGASIGIATTRSARIRPEELLRRADLAMYEAKKNGQRRWQRYSEGLQNEALRRTSVQHDLRDALRHGWLRLRYQPVMSLDDGGIVGAEALLRVAHPQRGLLLPSDFIEIAEETDDIIVAIGEWVMHEACRQLAEWQPGPPFELGINVSGRQASSLAVTGSVLSAAAQAGIDPSNLVLEMTEHVLIGAGESIVADLRRVTEHGVTLSIDDFGTGYASLTYLQRFPVRAVKIDRSFVAGLGHRKADTAIVQAVVALGQALDLTVTAEGVENADQLAMLCEMGCRRAQGFYLAAPLEAEEMRALLEPRAAAGAR